MNAGNWQEASFQTAWQAYQAREQSSRARYLNAVQAAWHEYIPGPYPDRDAYNTMERDAWFTYYAACRDAWRTFRTANETSQPPPPPEYQDPAKFQPAYRETGLGFPGSAFPMFTPNQEGGQ